MIFADLLVDLDLDFGLVDLDFCLRFDLDVDFCWRLRFGRFQPNVFVIFLLLRYLGFAFQETDKSIKTVLLERLPLIRVRRGSQMQPLITKKLHRFGAQTQTLDSLCRICLEILLADDFYEESGICFGPNHQHSTTSSNQISSNLRENPIYAKFPCVTSRNQIVEEAYRARNQIKSNPIPADATFCMVCVKKNHRGTTSNPRASPNPRTRSEKSHRGSF